jgi:hypothetical protein
MYSSKCSPTSDNSRVVDAALVCAALQRTRQGLSRYTLSPTNGLLFGRVIPSAGFIQSLVSAGF